jgi:hypothetical protein
MVKEYVLETSGKEEFGLKYKKESSSQKKNIKILFIATINISLNIL